MIKNNLSIGEIFVLSVASSLIILGFLILLSAMSASISYNAGNGKTKDHIKTELSCISDNKKDDLKRKTKEGEE